MPDCIAEHRRVSRIEWRDTDKTGYAHFTTYIRLMEETEYSFLRSRGLSVIMQDSSGTIGFPRLSTRLAIRQPVRLNTNVEIRLRLIQMDGKQIVYEFDLLTEQGDRVGDGLFRVAACRFPPGQLPYAILTPEYVMTALRSPPQGPN